MKILCVVILFTSYFVMAMEKQGQSWQAPVAYQQPTMDSLHSDLKLSIIGKLFDGGDTPEKITEHICALRLVSKHFATVIDSNHTILLGKLSQRTDNDILLAAKISPLEQSRKYLREHFPISLQKDMDFFCSTVKNKVKKPADIQSHSFFINRSIELLIAGCKKSKVSNNQFTLIHLINTCRGSLPTIDDRKSLHVSGHIKIAELLYNHKMLHSGHTVVLQWLQMFGNTIHLAIKTENEGFIDLLLHAGAHINAGDKYQTFGSMQEQKNSEEGDGQYYSQDGMTPLDRVIQQVIDNAKYPDSSFCSNPNKGYLKRVAILLERGAKSADDNNFFVLAETAYRNDVKALQLLLKSGMNCAITDEGGNTFIHHVIAGLILGFQDWGIDMTDFLNNYTLPILELLLQRDVNPDACNQDNDTALALFQQEIDELKNPINGNDNAIIVSYEYAYEHMKSLLKKYGAQSC